MLYSPKNRALVSTERKRSKIEQTQTLALGNDSFEVIWKDSQATPAEDLERLSQFTMAYVSTIIDKAYEVQQLLKEKYERIMELE